MREVTTAVYRDGVVYVPSETGDFYALNTDDGSVRWSDDHTIFSWTEAVVGDTIYTSTAGVVVAFTD